jgi:hypothetical protein
VSCHVIVFTCLVGLRPLPLDFVTQMPRQLLITLKMDIEQLIIKRAYRSSSSTDFPFFTQSSTGFTVPMFQIYHASLDISLFGLSRIICFPCKVILNAKSFLVNTNCKDIERCNAILFYQSICTNMERQLC